MKCGSNSPRGRFGLSEQRLERRVLRENLAGTGTCALAMRLRRGRRRGPALAHRCSGSTDSSGGDPYGDAGASIHHGSYENNRYGNPAYQEAERPGGNTTASANTHPWTLLRAAGVHPGHGLAFAFQD